MILSERAAEREQEGGPGNARAEWVEACMGTKHPSSASGSLTTHPWEGTALGERAGNVHVGPAMTAKSTTDWV